MKIMSLMIAAAGIALILIGAQGYAVTRILKATHSVERQWPETSVRETLEYLQGHQWEWSGRAPDAGFGWPLPARWGRAD